MLPARAINCITGAVVKQLFKAFALEPAPARPRSFNAGSPPSPCPVPLGGEKRDSRYLSPSIAKSRRAAKSEMEKPAITSTSVISMRMKKVAVPA